MSLEVVSSEDEDVEIPMGSAEDEDETADERPAKPAGKPGKGGKRPPPPAMPPRPAPVPRERPTPDQVAESVSESEDIREWIDGFATAGHSIRVSVIRKMPRMFKGVKTDGLLQTYSEKIDEDFIRSAHGGGTYQLRISTPNKKGSWEYKKSRTIEIPGDPRTDDVPRDSDGSDKAGPTVIQASRDPIAEKAFDFMVKQALSSGNGMDPKLLELLLAPVRAQNEQLVAQVTRLMATIDTLRDKKPETDPFKDKFLEKLIDGDSTRILAVKTAYDSEIAALKAAAVETEKRLRDQADREIARITSAHDREIVTLRATYDQTGLMAKQTGDLQSMLLGRDNQRLERELGEARAEIVVLRAKKDQTILEKAEEVTKIKELMGGGEEAEKSSFDKIVDVVDSIAKSKGVIDLVGKAVGGGEKEAAAADNGPPIGKPYQGPDGSVYMRTADGVILLRKKKKAKRPGAQAQAGAAAAPGGDAPPPGEGAPGEEGEAPPTQALVRISREDADRAISMIETAFATGQDPAVVGRSARHMVPGEVIQAIRDRGVDDFLDKVAHLPSNSPLTQQAGRNYVRKVARALLD